MSTDVEIGDAGVKNVKTDFFAPDVAKAFIEDTSVCTGFFGSLGCSKTTSGVMKAYFFGRKWPGARIAVIRDTWPNLRDTTQHTFFQWFPPKICGEYVSTRRTFYLRNESGEKPTEILFRAMDDREDMGNVLSLDISSFWIDEPQGGLSTRNASTEFTMESGIDHDLFLAIMGRLGRQKGYPGMSWLTGNPPDPYHWIAREFGYTGVGEPQNTREDFQLYLGTRETNRKHLQHHFHGSIDEPECRLCGNAEDDIIHQRDYYEFLESIYGVGTALALRFIEGKWVSFALLNPFREEWIRYWDERPKLDQCFLCLGVDPAISKKDSANRSALVLAAQPMQGLYRTTAFILRAVADRWSPYELCDSILKLVTEFPMIRKIRIEEAQWQGALKPIVEREGQLKGMHLPAIDLVPQQVDKLIRANSWSGLVQSARVLFGPGQTDLIDCMLSVPRDKSKWDPVDAGGLALGGLPNMRAELSPMEQRDLDRRRASSYAAKTGERVLNLYGGKQFVQNLLGKAHGDPRARAVGYNRARTLVS